MSDITDHTAPATTTPGGTGHDYNPMVPPYRDDPYPFYRWSRQEQPVVFLESLGAWAVTRYDDVVRILRDPARFSSAVAIGLDANPPQVLEKLRDCIPWGTHVVNTDPPEHGPARRIANKIFRAQRFHAFRPRMRAIADELIDAFVHRGHAELVGDFTSRFTFQVIAELAGVEPADLDRVALWNEDNLALMSPTFPLERKLAAAERMADYDAYVLDLIEQRRSAPRDDIMSDLVHLEERTGEPPMDLPDLVGFWRGLFGAGIHTTKDAIGNTLYTLLEQREHWESACANSAIIPDLLEESLRRDAPHRGLFRLTTEEVELGGITLPPGSRLLLLFGSANRDESRFPEPDEFRPQRSSIGDHVAFGGGIHHCVGSQLARLEGQVALEALTDRLPDLRLAPGFVPRYSPTYFFRGLEHLDVVWTPRD